MTSQRNITTGACIRRQCTSDRDGDYPYEVNEILLSPMHQYEVLQPLGRGTFGQVLKCWKKGTLEIVAVKILRNLSIITRQGEVEISMLSRLGKENADEFNIVRAFECFKFNSHTCMVFEMLDLNLYEFIKKNKFAPMPLRYIRPILKQVFITLDKLKKIGIVHGDLKPENIMLVESNRQPYRVKVIDFGSACYSASAAPNTYLQSRYYRAPEIIMGLRFNEAIDMWSLGCIAVELFLGLPIFPGRNEHDQLRYIIEIQGLPTEEMLNNASKTSRFFYKDKNSQPPLWKLKTPEMYEVDTGVKKPQKRRSFNLDSLDDILRIFTDPGLQPSELLAENADRRQFLALLKKMLTVDPKTRVEPEEALNDCFLSLEHLAEYGHCNNVKKSFEAMEICKSQGTVKNPASNVSPTSMTPKLVSNPKEDEPEHPRLDLLKYDLTQLFEKKHFLLPSLPIQTTQSSEQPAQQYPVPGTSKMAPPPYPNPMQASGAAVQQATGSRQQPPQSRMVQSSDGPNLQQPAILNVPNVPRPHNQSSQMDSSVSHDSVRSFSKPQRKLSKRPRESTPSSEGQLPTTLGQHQTIQSQGESSTHAKRPSTVLDIPSLQIPVITIDDSNDEPENLPHLPRVHGSTGVQYQPQTSQFPVQLTNIEHVGLQHLMVSQPQEAAPRFVPSSNLPELHASQSSQEHNLIRIPTVKFPTINQKPIPQDQRQVLPSFADLKKSISSTRSSSMHRQDPVPHSAADPNIRDRNLGQPVLDLSFAGSSAGSSQSTIRSQEQPDPDNTPTTSTSQDLTGIKKHTPNK